MSWLLLGGKCAGCGTDLAPLPARRTLHGHAVRRRRLALRLALAVGRGACFTWSLVALTVIDLDHQLLPDVMTLPLLWLGLLLSLAWHPGLAAPIPVDSCSAIIGAAAGYLSLWSVYWAFKLLTGKEGMGYGDFKLFAALGAWLGWQMLLLIMLLSAFTGAVVGIALIVLRGRDRNIPIPFGPYLAAAGWIALMWGPQIVDGYLSITGLGPLSRSPGQNAMSAQPFRVALTGGIASGKSTVADLFAALGVPVIDTDVIAREVVEPGQPALAAVVAAFGPDVLDADGRLDRRRLRELIFADPDAKRRLEAILHPAIRAEMERQSTAARRPLPGPGDPAAGRGRAARPRRSRAAGGRARGTAGPAADDARRRVARAGAGVAERPGHAGTAARAGRRRDPQHRAAWTTCASRSPNCTSNTCVWRA